jgi:hypothetical protein
MRGVKLLRCYFDSRLDMQHVRPSKFEEIFVPEFQTSEGSSATSKVDENEFIFFE